MIAFMPGRPAPTALRSERSHLGPSENCTDEGTFLQVGTKRILRRLDRCLAQFLVDLTLLTPGVAQKLDGAKNNRWNDWLKRVKWRSRNARPTAHQIHHWEAEAMKLLRQ